MPAARGDEGQDYRNSHSHDGILAVCGAGAKRVEPPLSTSVHPALRRDPPVVLVHDGSWVLCRAFETEPFDRATVACARHVAKLTKEGTVVSVAGGGDTVAALNHAGIADDFTYVSTAGGAFLEWLEGKTLPGVAALSS
jgi:hypothetical protein